MTSILYGRGMLQGTDSTCRLYRVVDAQTDLDHLKPGNYHITRIDSPNLPLREPGCLLVRQNNRKAALFQTYHTFTHRQFTRFYENAWQPWKENNDGIAALVATRLGEGDFTGSNQRLFSTGYQKLPGGLIIQWGTLTSSAEADSEVIFPIPFPNALFSKTGTYRHGARSANIIVSIGAHSRVSMHIGCWIAAQERRTAGVVDWIALGG